MMTDQWDEQAERLVGPHEAHCLRKDPLTCYCLRFEHVQAIAAALRELGERAEKVKEVK